MKALYYDDNLQVLRDSIATESVDLIYLDPPFNSKATYNVGLLGESGRDRMRGRTAACQKPSLPGWDRGSYNRVCQGASRERKDEETHR